MKKYILLLSFVLPMAAATAQSIRPDAFPPAPDTLAPKALAMAQTVEEMYAWDKYPTYDVYVAMMQQFADSYPELCRLDTIGLSI